MFYCFRSRGQRQGCLAGKGTRNDAWLGSSKAGGSWLSGTNARDVDGWDMRRVWVSRDDARHVEGEDDAGDSQARVAVCWVPGAQTKSLSWQGWQYILSPHSRKVPLFSRPRQ